MLKVIKSGVFTSIQDKGRFQYRSYGVPVSGAMDQYAYEQANRIIGNELNAAALEVIFGGVEFLVLEDIDIAITGADLNPQVDGQTVDMWKPMTLLKNQKLTFKGPKAGVIAYVALPGGIDSKTYLGSQSVYEKAGFGKRLASSDTIIAKLYRPSVENDILSMDIPTYINEVQVNVIPSPHEQLFTSQSIQRFYEEPFTVQRGDRMGTLLKGSEPLSLNKPVDLVSEAVTFGTVQVPPSGQPMVLLADAQTTGGYPTLGTIHSDDLWRAAQIPPKGSIKFNRLSQLG
ncbi:biotin-dependent carboxyltransferase family protein [Filobacillus milosensis]|uniref:Biotin-dependent carboxyltransferase family protein n=1 Tax=Filobacillus milosensis TaxID=94137 RepID=A0A4Y8IHB2_9BACI|nr:biotin-dependent carboxyltransferase family protein [Filobacillus milosensis]TFB15076.1 biotin-dependent carboxyltransferase family protein [Filobacillus milosensis]